MSIWHRESELQGLANSLLHLFNYMPQPKVFLNPRMDVDAHASGSERIEFSMEFVETASQAELERLMKHELIHIWMDWRGLDSKDNHDHGPLFQAKARELGL